MEIRRLTNYAHFHFTWPFQSSNDAITNKPYFFCVAVTHGGCSLCRYVSFTVFNWDIPMLPSAMHKNVYYIYLNRKYKCCKKNDFKYQLLHHKMRMYYSVALCTSVHCLNYIFFYDNFIYEDERTAKEIHSE